MHVIISLLLISDAARSLNILNATQLISVMHTYANSTRLVFDIFSSNGPKTEQSLTTTIVQHPAIEVINSRNDFEAYFSYTKSHLLSI